MDESTKGVTLLAGFVLDAIGEHRGDPIFAPLMALAVDVDENAPEALVPIDIYNDCCSWIETKLGTASIRKAGAAIGVRALARMKEDGQLGNKPTPSEIFGKLKWAADNMIQDPQGRGWTILVDEPGHFRLRRTQTFNCMLQEGLLDSFLRITGVYVPVLEHAQCTRRGDEFCEYDMRWDR